jgi:hypothetical protein
MLTDTLAPQAAPAAALRTDAASRHLRAKVTDVARLTRAERARMFEIYAAHYDGTSRARFDGDLAEKHLVLTVHADDGAIQGFTTLLILEQSFAGRRLRAIYSGDTIIDRAYWGSQALAFNWIRLAGAIKAEEPDVPLYWFLIVKGHRTYRYLSAFSKCFYPHWDAATPDHLQALMDHLAEERFPGFYRPELGVIHFPESHGHLKPRMADISAAESARPDVAYFLSRNPGYRNGDELVCLTELHADNLTTLARKQFLAGFQK